MLTRKKIEFINHYIRTKNATESAKLSGYSVRTAYSQGQRLLRNVEVKGVLDKRFQEIDERLNIDEDNIRKHLLDEALHSKRASDRIRAWELLGKSINMFKDQQTQGVMININDTLEALRVKRVNDVSSSQSKG